MKKLCEAKPNSGCGLFEGLLSRRPLEGKTLQIFQVIQPLCGCPSCFILSNQEVWRFGPQKEISQVICLGRSQVTGRATYEVLLKPTNQQEVGPHSPPRFLLLQSAILSPTKRLFTKESATTVLIHKLRCIFKKSSTVLAVEGLESVDLKSPRSSPLSSLPACS